MSINTLHKGDDDDENNNNSRKDSAKCIGSIRVGEAENVNQAAGSKS